MIITDSITANFYNNVHWEIVFHQLFETNYAVSSATFLKYEKTKCEISNLFIFLFVTLIFHTHTQVKNYTVYVNVIYTKWLHCYWRCLFAGSELCISYDWITMAQTKFLNLQHILGLTLPWLPLLLASFTITYICIYTVTLTICAIGFHEFASN